MLLDVLNVLHLNTPHLSVRGPLVVVAVQVSGPGAKVDLAGGGAARLRLASIFKVVTATGGPSVIDGTDVSDVAATPPSLHAAQQPVKQLQQPHVRQFSPALKIKFWSEYLPKIYSQEKSQSLLSQLCEGVRIGRVPAEARVESPNWPSAYEHRDQVAKIIADDLAAGRLDGPYRSPPYSKFIVSPLGAFTKRASTKVRLIHDLSYPHQGSVNASISQEEFSLSYTSVDDAAALCRQLGPSPAYMAKLDLQDAFKHIFVDTRDWHLLGFVWPDDFGNKNYYFSRVLNFGLRSSPYLFDIFASALLDIVHYCGVPRTIVRYVDDFIVVAPTKIECQTRLDSVIKLCQEAGFSIQASKITAPSTTTEFLGIVIDSEREELRISQERLRELTTEVDTWLTRDKATKRQLLSLIGKLSFAAKVVRTGRAFISRLLVATKHARALHHHVKLSKEAKADLQWWAQCISSHNGTSYYNPSWAHEGVVHVYTDASNDAYGALCGTEWIQMAYTGSIGYMRAKSINWREFHAAVTAIATWANLLRGKSVVFHVDNMVVCYILNSLYSPVQELMHFVRQWCLIVERYSIQVAVVYIDTKANIDADDLSRLRTREFLDRNTQVRPHMTWPEQGFMSEFPHH